MAGSEGQLKYVGWKGIPVDDCPGEKCELVVDYQSCDMLVCRRMIPGKTTSAPDQVISCMMATRSYVSMRRWSRVWVCCGGGGGGG